MNSKLLNQQTVLITGGTSRLGEAFVLKAIDQGAEVLFTYHQNQNKAEELIAKGAKGYQLNLLDMEAAEAFCKTVKGEIKKLDSLIHNAAVIRDHTMKNLTSEEWDDVMTADLKAPYLLTKKLLSLLFKKREDQKANGKIFFMTSRVALKGGIGVSNYAAAKAGLIGLSKSLAQELGKKKILVNAINPGFMKSAMTQDLPEAVIEKNLSHSPLNDWSNPEEVAGFLVYLCSPLMGQITGQVLSLESRAI